jgi:hypothetical protein
MNLVAHASSAKLGLLGTGDAHFPNFAGRTDMDFDWSGLNSTSAHSLLDQAWSLLHYSGAAPPGFLPANGPLYTDYPTQLFAIAEEVDNFGSISAAEQWMSLQRSGNAPNSNPKTNNGLEIDPPVSRIGDQTFAYQIIRASAGDVFTDVIIRQGDLILAVSDDGGPGSNGVNTASSLIRALLAKEQATCATS